MSARDLIAALDGALAAVGEDVILRRPKGTGASQTFSSVTCRAQLSGLREDQISAGISQTEVNFILSPSEISRGQWPGGVTPALPPFDVDQSIPRAQSDQFIARGKVRTITFVDAKIIAEGGVPVVVRIDGRMTG